MSRIKKALLFCAAAIVAVLILQWVAANGVPYVSAVNP